VLEGSSTPDIAAAKIAIEQDDRGFHPDSSFLRRMTETWNKYGQLGKLPAPPVLPQSLDQAGELWSACAQCCAQELRDYQNDHGNWEQRRRGVFGNRPDEPRLSSRFQNAWLTLRAISRRNLSSERGMRQLRN
jgi:hypothetical protein